MAPEPATNPTHDPRPGLRVVPPPVAPASRVTEDQPEPAVETPAAAPGPPRDVRMRDAVSRMLAARPRWSERPPSAAETWEWSREGDWATDDQQAKRVAHGLCVLVAFAVTYPVDWAVRVARGTPGGFLLVLLVLFVLGKAI